MSKKSRQSVAATKSTTASPTPPKVALKKAPVKASLEKEIAELRQQLAEQKKRYDDTLNRLEKAVKQLTESSKPQLPTKSQQLKSVSMAANDSAERARRA